MNFDLAIIGGGPGGYTAADHAAKNGMSVVLFEADLLGGTCLNRGCIPTKALLHSSEAFHSFHSTPGVKAENVSYDFAAMHEYKANAVGTLRSGVEKLMKGDKVTVVNAFAHVTACSEQGVTVEAGGETYEAAHLIVASGSVPSVPPIEGSKLPGVYTSNDLLENGGKDLKSLIIIGGGVIGCECASIYLNLGAQVVILEALDHILPPMDREIAQRLTMFFKKRGASVNASCKVTAIEGEPGNMTVHYTDKAGKEQTCTGEGVLIATGRRANVVGIFPEGQGPESERGALVADEAGKTSIPSIYVIGDAKARNIQLAHVAEAQAKNAVAAILGHELPVDMNVVPSCIYTSPEIASVGLTEDECKAKGIAVKAKKLPTGANAKCVIEQSESGYVKIVTDAASGKLLGAQLVCPRATDLVSEFALAISHGMTAEQIASVIHPHPTFSELVSQVCEI
ncbi:MAG: dihydrolipoyl dehydrogenase [Ruminococcaceae bacterium]|nr:dihydrolipoyl dehydrogenase [Oscillospiraceae bacterium]